MALSLDVASSWAAGAGAGAGGGKNAAPILSAPLKRSKSAGSQASVHEKGGSIDGIDVEEEEEGYGDLDLPLDLSDPIGAAPDIVAKQVC